MNWFFKVLIASWICLVGVFTPFGDSAEAQDVDKIKGLMTELNTELTPYVNGPGDGSEMEKELLPLVQSIQNLRKKNMHAYIIAAMTDLESALNKTPTILNDPKVIDKAFKLAPEIAKLESQFPFQAAKDRAKRLTALIQTTPRLDKGEATLPEISALLNKLLEAESFYTLSAVERRAQVLLAILEKIKGNYPKFHDIAGLLPLLISLETKEQEESNSAIRRRAPIIKGLIEGNVAKVQADESTKKALANLKVSIEKAIPARLKPRIHVVDASYGDVSPGAKANRKCQAVHAVINKCQAKTQCQVLPTDVNALCDKGSPSDFNLITGKRLEVKYKCIVAGQGRMGSTGV